MPKKHEFAEPMRIQARQNSPAEKQHYLKAALPSGMWHLPKAIAPGIDPSPLDDLVYHGGKLVPQMEFQNVYLGSSVDWSQRDIDLIDAAITRAMQAKSLNNVMSQYFLGSKLSCDPRPSVMLDDAKPQKLNENDVQAKVIELYDEGTIKKTGLDKAIFNLILPPGTVLELDGSSSLRGLGGYHGSVHVTRSGKHLTLYYSANVYSQRLSTTRENGIAVFGRSWKNVVGTLYHELNEFRTDPDVNDAIENGDNDYLGWTSRRGHECGDQPIFEADPLTEVFKEVLRKRTPVQFMFSNAVHGAEGPIGKPHA
jgi:hypothetical protein